MRAIIIFCLFVVLAFLLGAILAYPLKLALDPVFDLEYRRYLNYATLISGLIISGLYLKLYKLFSYQAFGYSGKPQAFFKNMLNGFMYGVTIMLMIELILCLLGIHEFDATRDLTIKAISLLLLKGFVAGLLIALLEESIFRGGLFSGLYKQTGAVITVFFSSLVYAAVHFVRYREVPTGTDIGWFTGLEMLPYAFRRFYEWSIADYFLTLFIFGVLLGLLRLKHRNIAACIGVHAGIVMLIKVANYFTNRTHNNDYNYLVSQYNSTFGWISFSVILLFTVFYYVKIAKKGQA